MVFNIKMGEGFDDRLRQLEESILPGEKIVSITPNQETGYAVVLVSSNPKEQVKSQRESTDKDSKLLFD